MRALVGIGAWGAPDLTARVFGIDPARSDRFVTRLFGAREIALAVALLSARPETLASVALTGALIDSADALQGFDERRRGNLGNQATLLGPCGAVLFAVTGAVVARSSGSWVTNDPGLRRGSAAHSNSAAESATGRGNSRRDRVVARRIPAPRNSPSGDSRRSGRADRDDHQFFEDKDALFQALARLYIDAMPTVIDEAFERTAATWSAAVDRIVDAYAQMIRDETCTEKPVALGLAQ